MDNMMLVDGDHAADLNEVDDWMRRVHEAFEDGDAGALQKLITRGTLSTQRVKVQCARDAIRDAPRPSSEKQPADTP